MRKNMILIIAVLCLAIFVLLTIAFANQDRSQVRFQNGKTVEVEVARTQAQQADGLSGRTELGGGEGMLFLHGNREIRYYWMKDMLIPIDIIWIDGERVAGYLERVEVEDPPYTLRSSVVPVDKVLEVNAGFVKDNNVAIGDLLDIRLPAE
jgi:uncharacterized membrane protein (UPF0127 family)